MFWNKMKADEEAAAKEKAAAEVTEEKAQAQPTPAAAS